MSKFFVFTFFITIGFAGSSIAQETLPNITVKNQNGVIIISWKNDYPLPVKNINIQRSYDSLRNYTTIGSVLNPQNRENGYADVNPPYNKMYYRVFISFDGGAYRFSEPARPEKDPPVGGAAGADSLGDDPRIAPKANTPEIISTPLITYPSRRIYTGRDNNVVINLPDAGAKKYQVKFFDENEAPLFDINKLPENYLIIEKVNFIRAGWYYFELYESGKIIEKNKFFIPKDGKPVPSKTEQGKAQ